MLTSSSSPVLQQIDLRGRTAHVENVGGRGDRRGGGRRTSKLARCGAERCIAWPRVPSGMHIDATGGARQQAVNSAVACACWGIQVYLLVSHGRPIGYGVVLEVLGLAALLVATLV